MTWNEEDHPRDEIGRFTFSGGGDNNNSSNDDTNYGKGNDGIFRLGVEYNDIIKNAKETLYQSTLTTKANEKEKTRYINRLLDILGNKATNTDKLYPNTKKLEQKIKDMGLGGKLKSIRRNIAQFGTERAIGGNFNKYKFKAAQCASGPDTAGMLDLAHGESNMNDKNYIKDAIRLKNYDDPSINHLKKDIYKKVKEQFKDYNYNPDDIPGYFFKKESEPCRRMILNEDFRKFIKENKNKILSGEKNSIAFPKHDSGIGKENNFRNALGKADIKDAYMDKGNFYLKIFDTYDFNKSADDFLNKAGASQMDKGNLKPYFSIHDIMISKDELDRIMNE